MRYLRLFVPQAEASRYVGIEVSVQKLWTLSHHWTRHWSVYAILCLIFPALWLQNPFRYPRQMDGLQSVLSQLPTIGVYVVGAAAAAALGLTGSSVAGSIAPGRYSAETAHTSL